MHVIKYAHENGCPWDENVCSEASKGGCLDVLKYAHENGCPWNKRTCEYAAREENFDMLKYAHENGCRWDEITCYWTVITGRLDMLKYAREEGCPWNRSLCLYAARRLCAKGHEGEVEYINAQPLVAWIMSQPEQPGEELRPEYERESDDYRSGLHAYTSLGLEFEYMDDHSGFGRDDDSY